MEQQLVEAVIAKKTDNKKDFEFTHEHEDETIKFKSATGPATLDKHIPPEHLSKIYKHTSINEMEMPINPDKPKYGAWRRQRPPYLAKIRVHEILAKLHNELVEIQPIDVSKLIAEHSELQEAANSVLSKPIVEKTLRNYINEYLDTEYYSGPGKRSAIYSRLTQEEVLEQHKFKKDNSKQKK